MTLLEFRSWLCYRNRRGSLNAGMRIDRGAALLAMLYSNSHRKNGWFKLYDFTPYEEEPPVSLEQAMKEWV